MALGANSAFGIRLGTTGSYVQMLGAGVGCDSVTTNFDKDTRAVPGGGNYEVTEVVDHIEGSISFEVDENLTTRALYWGKGLRRFSFQWTPAGGTMQSGEAISTIIHTYGERGPRRFAVTLAVDGDTT